MGHGVRGLPADCQVEQVGETSGYSAFGQRAPLYLFEVTLPNGTVVPAYSWTAGTGDKGFVICQSYAHKAFVPNKSLAHQKEMT
jgi:hypothetical protein